MALDKYRWGDDFDPAVTYTIGEMAAQNGWVLCQTREPKLPPWTHNDPPKKPPRGVPSTPWKNGEVCYPELHQAALNHRNHSVLKPDWIPGFEVVPSLARRIARMLQGGLRAIQETRVSKCGFCSRSGDGNIPVMMTPDGRAHLGNLQHCWSVWACPGCALVIKTERAKEVTTVIERHGRERAIMMTLTVSHGLGDDLKKLLADLMSAFRRFTTGAPWDRIKAALGIEGHIRAIEVTHGEANGWHPHIHIVFLLKDKVPEGELVEVDGRVEWMTPLRDRIIDRWATMVERECGPEHRPDAVHGVSIAPIHSVAYLSKLGLEVTGQHKRGKNGSRTPSEIASDYCKTKSPRDAQLYKVFCSAFKGARYITWSRGLKKKHLLEERTDAECADDEPEEGDMIVGRITPDVWKKIRSKFITIGGEQVPATVYVLECAERGGPRGLHEGLVDALGRDGVIFADPDLEENERRYYAWVAGLVRDPPLDSCSQ